MPEGNGHDAESGEIVKIEYVLWGRPKGSSDAIDEKVLATDSKLGNRMDKIKEIASADGWHSFRIQKLDLSVPPDFMEAIGKGKL